MNQQFFDRLAQNIIIEEQSFDVKEDLDISRQKRVISPKKEVKPIQ